MQLDYYLDLYTAILGEEITISDFDDAILQLRVAAGTQMGIKIILKGKGFPVYKKEEQFGNLYVNYQVQIPQQLSEEEKELFNKLAQLSKK
jgi:curved DNA-binding protein